MFACCIKHDPSTNIEPSSSRKEIWLGKLDFFMSVMGFNIGLGNLLRFPYLCMKNGGGAFIIPYFFFLVTVGIPLFLIEMSLAQYSGMTPLEFYGNISPIFKGIGWCNVIGCAIYNIYYNLLMAWILIYIGSSVLSPLPWSKCENFWNTDKCRLKTTENSNYTEGQCSEHQNIYTTPAEEYWEHYVLKISSGIGHFKSMNMVTVLCLILAWISVFICVFKGIKSMGRVVYVTALSPYVFLIILLVRGLTLEGSGSGIKFYLYPQLEKLAQPKVWMEAGQQIFWSLAPGWGITISLASHNPFNHNIYRDAIVLPVVSCLTSFLGGFVIFSFIGHISYRYKENIKCVFKVGPGLAFNVYPEALQYLPIPQIWCVLFFLLLFVLGLDSSFTSFETVYDSLKYNYSRIFDFDIYVKIGITCISFLVSLPLTTQAGFYIYQLIDYYQIAFLPLTVLIETLMFAYVYGITRVKSNIYVMTGYDLSLFWDIIWKYLLPIILVVLFCFGLATQSNLSYGLYNYPTAAIVLGWLLALFGFLPIPLYMIFKLISVRRNLGQLTRRELRLLLQPTSRWIYDETSSTNLNIQTDLLKSHTTKVETSPPDRV